MPKVYIAIGLGIMSNINFERLRKWQNLNSHRCVCSFFGKVVNLRTQDEAFRDAQMHAEVQFKRFGVPICIGISAATVDVAKVIENGTLREDQIFLSPVSSSRAKQSIPLHENVFAEEAMENLLKLIEECEIRYKLWNKFSLH